MSKDAENMELRMELGQLRAKYYARCTILGTTSMYLVGVILAGQSFEHEQKVEEDLF